MGYAKGHKIPPGKTDRQLRQVHRCHRSGGEQDRHALYKQVIETSTNGGGGDSLNDAPKIERRYGDCDVTITFKEKAEDVKDDVLWLMLENYKERISEKAAELENNRESLE